MKTPRRSWQLLGTVFIALIAIVAIVSGLAHAVTALNVTATDAARHQKSLAVAIPTPRDVGGPLLSVQGTQIVDAHNKPVTLLGATRFSLEFSCSGDGHLQPADFQAMRTWGINTVRLTLSSAYWRNIANQCPDYQTTVTTAVENAEAAGLYVVLALQWNAPFDLPVDATHGGAQCPLPDASNDVAFWKDIASIYQSDQRVLFDIFSEPFNVSWRTWANGGTITSACSFYPQPHTYQAIGMPALALQVRAVAPSNIIIVSGIGYGYDLSGIAGGTLIPTSNILYATHPFDHKTAQQPGDWYRAFGQTAQSVPVIVTEFGAYDCTTGYITQAMSYFERLHVSMLAWEWSPSVCATPSLLADWSGTPSRPYGAAIQQEMQKLAAAQH